MGLYTLPGIKELMSVIWSYDSCLRACHEVGELGHCSPLRLQRGSHSLALNASHCLDESDDCKDIVNRSAVTGGCRGVHKRGELDEFEHSSLLKRQAGSHWPVFDASRRVVEYS